MDASGHLFSPGDLIQRRFRVVRLLGSGGMGEVYLAERIEDGGLAALKMLLPELLGNQKSLARFEREVRSTQAIDHPNVVRIEEYLQLETSMGPESDFYIPCLVMEYLEGESVADRVEREGPLDDALAIAIVRQMAAALGAAHRVGIVHRDLKPDNVFLVAEDQDPGAPPRVVLTDFGVARRGPQRTDADLSGDSLTASNVVIGTPEFMAPELLELEDALPASDLYALGLVAYQMVIGKLPFEDEQPLKALFMRVREPAPSPLEDRPDLDPKLAAVIETCLERRPEDRFDDAEAIVRALGPAKEPPSSTGLQVLTAAMQPELPTMTRDHYIAIAIGVLMLLLVAVLVLVFADPGVA